MNAYFYPHELVPTAVITHVLNYLSIDVTTNPKADLKFHWDYKDVNLGHKGWINGECKNVEKWYVDQVFTEVFGYSSFIDPTKSGICIKKNIQQCTKSAELIVTPCMIENGFIYQKYINNVVNGHREVLRLVIAKKDIMIHTKIMQGLVRDGAEHCIDVIVDWDKKLLSKDEKEKTILLCEKMGMEWGELDALRDSDGKLYIIDVNNIPAIQSVDKIKDRDRFMKELSEMFKKNFL